MNDIMSKMLGNYAQLVAKVDRLSRGVESAFGDQLACRKGCSSCCRHLSLFWVEGAALALSLRELPEEEAAHLRSRARRSSPEDPCPLLQAGLCRLYPARPIICRTQGLPLLSKVDEKTRIDFCPKNFRGVASLPSTAVVDLELLNTALAAVNALFVREFFGGTSPPGERLTVAEALLLDL